MGLRSYGYILGPMDRKKLKNFLEQSDGGLHVSLGHS